VSTINDYAFTKDFAREELVAAPASHAVDGAVALFSRFGWDPNPELLRTLMRESGLRV
jgi:hypothetical protein